MPKHDLRDIDELFQRALENDWGSGWVNAWKSSKEKAPFSTIFRETGLT